MREEHKVGLRELSPYPEDFVMSSLLAHAEDLGRLGSSMDLTCRQNLLCRSQRRERYGRDKPDSVALTPG